jgi:hypothetical protein
MMGDRHFPIFWDKNSMVGPFSRMARDNMLSKTGRDKQTFLHLGLTREEIERME